jgi:uncharacterized protein (DUF927 family)
MPTYVLSKESFLKFIEGHFDEETVVVVSSDQTAVRREKITSHLGEKEYFLTEIAIAADVFNLDDEEYDEAVKYTIVFIDRNELSEEGRNSIR